MSAEQLARVLTLVPTEPNSSSRSRYRLPAHRPLTYLPRRPRNGHHADCPSHTEPADHCGLCRSMRIGEETP